MNFTIFSDPSLGH